MPKRAYIDKRFSAASLRTIALADGICQSYASQGYTLTLRQLYYQFVSRDLIPNKDTEYKKLGAILNDARLAGLLDWSHMEDRTRNLRALSHWESPSQIIQSAAYSFRLDKWKSQPSRLEVWIEKDSLVGVIQGVCQANDVPYFSCRGYTSQSEVWSASQRLLEYQDAGQETTILHLGDHDPSGIAMTRDIYDKLYTFMLGEGGSPVNVQRLALNMSQVEQYSPPPNPAKLTDTRAYSYISRYGDESWELDALEPTVIGQLIQDAIDQQRDQALWAEAVAEEEAQRAILLQTAQHWHHVTGFIDLAPWEED